MLLRALRVLLAGVNSTLETLSTVTSAPQSVSQELEISQFARVLALEEAHLASLLHTKYDTMKRSPTSVRTRLL